ncbi:MAG: DUF1289 domain-containing protein [Paracoccaceae bacterium]
MSEDIWKRNEVDSPCVNICIVHPHANICTGCFRTIDEISSWSKMSETERKGIIKELPNRSSKLRVRRGGRAERLGN